MAKTAQERKDEKEFSEASQKLRTRQGWNAYMYARMGGMEHYEALDMGFAADFKAFRESPDE